MTQPQGKPVNYLGIGAAVVILAVVLVAVISQVSKPATNTVADNTQTEQDNTNTGTADAAGTSEVGSAPVNDTPEADVNMYKDGTYTMVGSYNSPAGPESIEITVTLKDGIITDTSAVPQATVPASVNWQGVFAKNYETLVVGKKIDEVSLDKVSGSSLTPKGFNDAITKIKAEAQA